MSSLSSRASVCTFFAKTGSSDGAAAIQILKELLLRVSHITEEVTSTMGFSIQLLKYAGSLLAGGKYLHKSQKKCHTQEHKSRHRQGLCEEEAFFLRNPIFSKEP